MILAAEYIFAIAAIINVSLCSVQLGRRCVCSISPETMYNPILWAFLTVPIHWGGAMTVFLRVRLSTEEKQGPSSDKVHSGWNSKMSSHFKHECQLSALQSYATLKARPENNWFLLFSWLTSTGIVLHIIYGTLALSSMLFISNRDAVGVVGRFLGSTLVCRAILTYEMRGIRRVVSAEKDRGIEVTEIAAGKTNEPENGMMQRPM